MVEVFGKEDETLTAPKLLSVTRGEGTVVLTFDTELRLLRGVTVEDFQVRDSSGIWQSVNGSIVGNTVVLNTAHLNGTTQVRYGFGARSIELFTGELLPLDVDNGLRLDGNTIIYSYGGKYYEFNSEDGQVIRVIKAGNLTNASGEPMPTFVATIS
jgi:outer membrane protein assembly factor BamB